ncbi:MAG: PorV/PorQ family protein [Ignavibacteria bacterium]|jgi:hypothetical protein
MKKLLFLVLLLNGTVLFAQNKVGTTAAEFLCIPVGAKAVGMGGAFVAVADDITAAYWNPGGLSRLTKNEFNANYAEWFIDTKLSWSGLGVRVTPDDYVAVSITILDYGEEPITTIELPEGTGETWNAMDLAIYLSYSRNLTDRFSIGGTAKYIQQRIWNESAHGFAFDVGLLFKTQLEGLNIGMAISNFGQSMQLDGQDLLQPIDIDESYDYNNSTITSKLYTDQWELPLIFTVGTAWEFPLSKDLRLTVAADAKIPSNQSTYANLGSQVQLGKYFYARAGYNSLFKPDAEEGLTLGGGINYTLAGLLLKIEYAYLDFGVLGDISRYSISINF